MTVDLNTLRANLIELHNWAVHQKDSESITPSKPYFQEFVSNKSATKLYQKSHWIGRIWRIYWWFQSLSFHQDPIQERVDETIKKTITAFKHFQMQAATDNHEYIDATFDLEGKCPISKNEFRSLKKRIHSFYTATNPFWLLRNKELSSRAKETLAFIYEQLPPKPYFISQHLIKIESLTGMLMPIGPLLKLAQEEHLNHLEELKTKHYLANFVVQELRLPFQKPKPFQYVVKVRFFHRTLKEVLSILNKKSSSIRKINANLPRLEIALSDRGFRLFDEVDSKYMSWRENLTGTKLMIGSKEILVGDRIGKKEEGIDLHALFEVPNEANHLIKTGINEASLSIEYEKLQRHQYGIKHTEYLSWDPKHRFVLVERIVHTVKEISLQYLKAPSVMRILYPIRDLLEALTNLYATPNPLKTKSIGFTSKGQLRTFRFLKKTPYSPTNLERFTFKCGLKNQDLYVGLMLGSRMHATSQIEYYASVLNNVLNGSNFFLFWASLKHFEFNSALKKQAEKFAKLMMLKRSLCEEELMDKYSIPDKKKFEAILDYHLKLYHLQKCIGSQIPECLVDDVCKKIVETLKLKPLKQVSKR